MYKSLCDSNFYPLIDRNAKYMSYDEKVAYRAEHGIPGTIDEWIAAEKMRTEVPTANPHKRGPFGNYPLWQDNVECILSIICKERLGEDDIRTPDEYTLTLRVRVPPTTGFLMHYWQSPTVIIDRYTGEFCGKLSPEWLRTVQTECRFWQNRTLMLEMLKYFARIPENCRVSRRVESWRSAMSEPVSGLLTWVRPWHCFNPKWPRNTHSHKPWVSDLSAEESQKLRKRLNERSPLRRKA